jgi:iron(III) transport system substrate-binding protein
VTEQRQPVQDENWPRDEFPRSGLLSAFWLTWFVVAVAIGISLAVLLSRTPSRSEGSVIAYCAQDQVFAEPIFREFEKETHIRVRAVFDSEAVKTVGLANKLLAESSHPRCDVFWGNEEMRTRVMASYKAFRETNGWAAFGYRSRRMVINTNHVTLASTPRSLVELTNVAWRGRIALANPQFGTTAAHLHALRQSWGGARWETWCRALAANRPLLVDGNSVVVKLVGAGEAWVGLTDSDDIIAGRQEGLPIAGLPINAETLLIPNTVGVVRDAPNPEPAQRLFEYLQRPQVVEQLMAAGALEGASAAGVSAPTLKVNWNELLGDFESATVKLNEIFLR